ncbi:hypothetical protein F5883DRAFT_109376 [Diaporthe sp. PMI_573]|nr:hypothetical protein F5883DRAFT_109376 [Diaporthaceae sp. PMI_573]
MGTSELCMLGLLTTGFTMRSGSFRALLYWHFRCTSSQALYHPHNHPAFGDANAPSWWSPTMAVRLSGFLFRALITSQLGRAGKKIIGRATHCLTLPRPAADSPIVREYLHCITALGHPSSTRSSGNAATHGWPAMDAVRSGLATHHDPRYCSRASCPSRSTVERKSATMIDAKNVKTNVLGYGESNPELVSESHRC